MLGDKHLELDMNMRSLIFNKYFTSYVITPVREITPKRQRKGGQ